MHEQTLKNHVAIVTGASRGIGAETAIAFGHAGAKVVLAARTTPDVEDMARRIRENGGEALAVAADVTQPNQVEHLMHSAVNHYGQIDIFGK